TTNRYVRIEQVLSAIARDLDLDCLYCSDERFERTDHPDRFGADWVIMQRKPLNKIVTTTGREVSGYVLKEDTSDLTLRAPTGGEIELRKTDIKSRTYAYKNGGMPIGVRMERTRVRLGWNGETVKDGKGAPIVDDRWRTVAPLPGPAWTDGYSNMMHPRVMPWIMPWRD
ncbi:MAG: hypothetical protein HYR84_03145, partial [Planctomycetes bacterium]|nr:hypothetical protein [Planctomycetota bacterium]